MASIGVIPVFILNNQLPAFDQKPFSTAEICSAVEKTAGFESVEGAQRIGGLWRIYARSSEARNKILIQGFTIRGVRVDVKDKNPFIVTSPEGEEQEIPATKLIISNVPLSFSDDEIMHAIKSLKTNVRSKLIAERDRDINGKLTRWKTGRRFMYIDVPSVPLPKFVEIGPFKASLFHKEQKSMRREMEVECGKCLGKGHRSAACDRPIKCRQCFKDGHRAGDTLCDMSPVVQRENSVTRSKSPVRDRPSKSADHDNTGMISSHDRASTNSKHGCGSKSPASKSSERAEPSSNSSTSPSGSVKPRKQSRGRQQKRQDKAGKKGNKGQAVLNFAVESSRSASGKRPRTVDSTPPQHPDKHSKQQKLGDKSDNDDEFRDVLSS